MNTFIYSAERNFCNQQAESPACSVCFHYISFAGKGRNFAVLKYSEILFKNTWKVPQIVADWWNYISAELMRLEMYCPGWALTNCPKRWALANFFKYKKKRKRSNVCNCQTVIKLYKLSLLVFHTVVEKQQPIFERSLM